MEEGRQLGWGDRCGRRWHLGGKLAARQEVLGYGAQRTGLGQVQAAAGADQAWVLARKEGSAVLLPWQIQAVPVRTRPRLQWRHRILDAGAAQRADLHPFWKAVY